MSDERWVVLVIAGFIALLVIFRAINKDTKGALMLGASLIVLAYCFLAVGCAVKPAYQPWMEVGMAYDFPESVGSNPACIVRVRQPVIPDRITASYVHHSSCRDLRDKTTIDQIEITARIPLGRAK